MAAPIEKLNKLHEMVTDSFIKRLELDAEDGVPTDAATLSSMTKFLKDNEVTADPAESSKLDSLQEQMIQRSKENKANQTSNILNLAEKLRTGTE